jgi:hypothetical protein
MINFKGMTTKLLVINFSLFLASCSLFNYEKQKASKVKNYFERTQSFYSPKMWSGTVGTHLYAVSGAKGEPISRIDSLIECDLAKCYTLLPDQGVTVPLLFNDKNFSKKLDDRLRKVVNHSRKKSCGVQYLAFHNGLPRTQYLKVFESLKKHRCGAELVAQKPAQFPPLPVVNAGDSSGTAFAAKNAQKPHGAKSPEQFIKASAEKCHFVKVLNGRISDGRKIKTKDSIMTALDSSLYNELDECKVSSADIITAIKLITYGTDDRAQQIYTKSILFADNEKNADLKVKADLKTWHLFMREIWQKPKAYSQVAF